MAGESSITDLIVKDIRFPTSLEGDGSDAVNDPDYSCAYVTIRTSSGEEGYGLTFTTGRGTDIVCSAIKAFKTLVIGRELSTIYNSFGTYWRELTQEPQMRWLGPEKGVTHLAVAAIINALWDLWARLENKPLWKLLADMDPEKLVSVIDFSYIEDALTKEEALEILRKGQEGKAQRVSEMLDPNCPGYPAYTTSAGWLGYSDDKIKRLCKEAQAEGFKSFKVKVGLSQSDDIRRVSLVREEIGTDKLLMVDANQRWGVQEAIEWMKPLSQYNIHWIEEPTSPDDILGHATIARALEPFGMGVATGEQCQNRTMFKQFLQARALHFCQIDSCRMGGPNEIIAVYLMAHKFGVPVCPHAGGVGLCELVQHLSIFDYICISGTMDNRMIEYIDHLHEHFVYPVKVKNGCYLVPKEPGYSIEMIERSLADFEYPSGATWQKLFDTGTYNRPSTD